MNTTESRLRAAFAARAEQLTEPKLDALAARHDAGQLEDLVLGALPRGEHTVVLDPLEFSTPLGRHRRWIPAALAAAAVAVVAVGVAAVAGTSHQANPPAVAPTTSTASSPGLVSPGPTASPTGSPTQQRTSSAAPYLGAGQTGARTDVPWRLVGAGWRLIQPSRADGPSASLFLYDPAGGRYLISDGLPTRSVLAGWSPDGGQAAIQLPDGGGVAQLGLRDGRLRRLVTGSISFLNYTRPRGLAMLVTGPDGLKRYGLDGKLQLTYPDKLNGIGTLLGFPAVYTADGSAFVTQGADRAFLLGNNGDPQRSYDPPAGYTGCRALREWAVGQFLERCQASGASALFLQSIAGGSAQLLTGQNFYNAWPLSNKDVLVQVPGGNCQAAGYRILHPDGSTSALRLPAGVPAPGYISNLDGDLATFAGSTGCPTGPTASIDYNLVTGRTQALLPFVATIENYPSS